MALQGRARRAPSPLVRDARLIALHEAGHAVAAHALGLVVTRVTIEPTYDTFYQKWRLGVTEIEVIGDLTRDFSFAMRDRLHREAIFSLAGPAAERRVVGRVPLDEAFRSDIAIAFRESYAAKLRRRSCPLPT